MIELIKEHTPPTTILPQLPLLRIIDGSGLPVLGHCGLQSGRANVANAAYKIILVCLHIVINS